MKYAKIDQMTNGWFIGNFEPSVFKTNNVEVAIKRYMNGARDTKHFHKVSTEYTVIVSGKVCMNTLIYEKNDIIIVEPGEVVDFTCLEDETITVVVKIPGAKDDKYLV